MEDSLKDVGTRLGVLEKHVGLLDSKLDVLIKDQEGLARQLRIDGLEKKIDGLTRYLEAKLSRLLVDDAKDKVS